MPIAPGLLALVAALALGGCGLAERERGPREAGRSHFFHEASTSFNAWTGLGAGCAPYYRRRYHRLSVHSPYADRCAIGGPRGRPGYGGALAYVDLQAIYHRDGDRAKPPQHPEWVLRDAGGNLLYVPFDCTEGTCSQFAADIGSRAFRNHVIDRIRRIPAPYRGIFIDDANWNLNVSDASGVAVNDREGVSYAPIDPRTRRPISAEDWRRYVADFLVEIERAFPDEERVINPVWWNPASDLDDPHVRRGVAAATRWNMERGTRDTVFPDVATGYVQELESLLDYVDRLHELGLGVTLDGGSGLTAGHYDATAPDRRGRTLRLYSRTRAEFEMAAYFLISNGRDMYSAGYGSCPTTAAPPGSPASAAPPCEDPWWTPYQSTDLGAPQEDRRTRSDGVLERRFERGLVLLNPPGQPARTIDLPANRFEDVDGERVSSVRLDGAEAVVLQRPVIETVTISP